jgi:predicted CoA-binding protein
MNIPNPPDSETRRILSPPALVCPLLCSEAVSRDSLRIATSLKRKVLRVIPPNSTLNPEALDERGHPELSAIPGELEIVDSLRDAARVSELADQAIPEGQKDLGASAA